MVRQHATPLLIGADGSDPEVLAPVSLSSVPGNSVSEAAIQDLIARCPSVLPIGEIDRQYANPVSICTELNTPAGAVDNLLVTATGLPVLVECKLWRNPEGRREVVGQILDYAKELSRFSSSDLQREASRRLGRDGDVLFEAVQRSFPDCDQTEFNDALTQNLRRGRFLLLIVGDGIREGVEAIAEYVQRHSGLHFTLGLVELPLFRAASGQLLVVPRVIAHTRLIEHVVYELPDGIGVTMAGASEADLEEELDPMTRDRLDFWTEFLQGLQLDDPEQPVARAAKQGYVTFPLPVPSGNCWLTVYRDVRHSEVGLFLSFSRDTLGEEAVRSVLRHWPDIAPQLAGAVRLIDYKGKPRVIESFKVPSLADETGRSAAHKWLRTRTNDFVNVFRPRIRTAMLDIQQGQR